MAAKRVTFVCEDMPDDARETEFIERVEVSGSNLADMHRQAKQAISKKYAGLREERIRIKRIEDLA